MGCVVLGYDGSPSAKAALTEAIAQARAFGDDLVVAFGDAPPGRSAGEEFREHLHALEEMGTKVLEEAAAEAREAGVEAETRLVTERPAYALDAVAKELGARLIVVGSYGENPLTSAILGSTPHKLLHFSKVPVLCVPAQKETS